MASDSDPRLKPNRTSVLSRAQLTALGFLVAVILMSLAAYYSEVMWEIEHVRKAHAYVSEKTAAANSLAFDIGDAIHSTPVMQAANDLAYSLGEGVATGASSMGSTLNNWANGLWDSYEDFDDPYYDYYDYYGYDYSDYYDSYDNMGWSDLFDDDTNDWGRDREWGGLDFEDSYFEMDYSYFGGDNGLFPDYFADEEDAAEFFQWSKDWQAGNEQSQFTDLAFWDDREFNDWTDYDFDYEALFWDASYPNLDGWIDNPDEAGYYKKKMARHLNSHRKMLA